MDTTLRRLAGIREYHCDIGFPRGFDIERYWRILPERLEGSKHYEERRVEKRLPIYVAREWLVGGKLITILFEGPALARYTVRGDWDVTRDLTVAVDATTGRLITGWYNAKDDWHRLTVSEYDVPCLHTEDEKLMPADCHLQRFEAGAPGETGRSV